MLFLLFYTLLQFETFNFEGKDYLLFTSSDQTVVFSSYRLSNPDRIVLEINGKADKTGNIKSDSIEKFSVSENNGITRFVFTVKNNTQYTVLNRKNLLIIGFSEKLFIEDSSFDSVYVLLQKSRMIQPEKTNVAVSVRKTDESSLVTDLVKDLDSEKKLAKESEEKKIAKAAEKKRLEKLEQERLAQEKIAKVEAEKKAREEAAEKERLAKLEQERLEEKIAKAEAEKKAREEAAEKERLAQLEQDKLEQEKIERERLEQEKIAKVEAEKKAREEAAEKERLAKLEQERLEEKIAKAEAEKKAWEEAAEKERLAQLEQKRIEQEKLSQPEHKKSVKTEEGEILHLKVTKAEPEKKLSETLPELPVTKLEKKGVLKNIYFRKFVDFSRVTMELTGETDYQFREIKGGYVIDVHNFEKIPKYLLNIIDTRGFKAEVEYIYPKKVDDILKIYIKTDPGMAVRKSEDGNMINFDFYKPTIQ